MATNEVQVCVTFYLIIYSSSIFLTLEVEKVYGFSSEDQIILKEQVKVSSISIFSLLN